MPPLALSSPQLLAYERQQIARFETVIAAAAEPPPGTDPLAPLDDALAFLRGGMSALRRRRARVG